MNPNTTNTVRPPDEEQDHFNFSSQHLSAFANADPDINLRDGPESICNYFSTESLQSLLSNNAMNTDDYLSLFHLNIRSLPKHFDDLTVYLSMLPLQFKIIGLTETWLTSQKVSLYNIQGYNHVHTCRSDRSGGGVSLFIHDSLTFSIRSDLTNFLEHEAESLFLECTIPFQKGKIIIGCIYRPPNLNYNTFIDCLTSTLNTISSEMKTCYILGDFNINLLHPQSYAFTDHLSAYAFYPLINKPTRITATNGTLIDNIFTNLVGDPGVSGILYADLSDHLPLLHLARVTSSPSSIIKPDKIFVRNYCQSNINKFTIYLSEVSWHDVENEVDAQKTYDIFCNTFFKLFDKAFPYQTKRIHNKASKSWLSKGLKKSIRKKHMLYKAYLTNPSPLNHKKYSSYRNKLHHLLRTSKRQHYHNKFAESSNDMKKTWSIIKEIMNKAPVTTTPCNEFKNDNELISDPIVIANEFNKFFTNIGPSLAKRIPDAPMIPPEILPPSGHLIFKPIGRSELEDIITKLKPKGAGHDGLRPSLLKKCLSSIWKPLLHILNCSLTTGIFPDQFKWAKVIPVFKSDDPSIFSNYRPISILPCLAKVLERIVYNRLTEYFSEHNLLYIHQYGFREKHSTAMALVQLMDKFSKALDNNEFTIGIFIDLSKAFDTVDHDILLTKLQLYGIKGVELQWFVSYLANRKQLVSWNGTESSYQNLTCGVPQGSILGPLLFLIYVNDLYLVSKIMFFILFADDTNIFLSDKNYNNLIAKTNSELSKIHLWFQTNKLSINVKKSSFMLFTHRHETLPDKDVKMADNCLAKVPYAKFLGVLIDEKLNWKKHISFISNKIAKNIGIISKIRHVIPRRCLISLYYTLIYPFLSYCNIVWASTYKTNLKHIFTLQKRLVRISTFSEPLTSSAPLFRKLEILNIYDINALQISLFVFQHRMNLLPSSFHNLFLSNNQVHSYPTRTSSDLHTVYFRTTQGQFTVRYQGPLLWNKLPNHLKNCTSLSLFKKGLKKHLLSISFPA